MTPASNLQAENLEKAELFLSAFHDKPILNHIGGQDCSARSGKTFESVSPIDMAPIATVARGDAADIDDAAKAASDAFPAWRDMDGGARRAILHRIADGIVARAEEIALLECIDTGQAFRFMSKAALRGADNFRFFADKAPYARDGQTLHAASQLNVTSRRPIGPVGVITPWNTPFMLSTWKIDRHWRRDAPSFTSRQNCPP
jgi:5-carboxymethyl-2-hydroxymuconic-semialdehyde dehydrogenase